MVKKEKAPIAYPKKKAKATTKPYNTNKNSATTAVSEPHVAFAEASFQFTFGGKHKSYEVQTGYGYFISPLRKAENIDDVSEYLESGITLNEIQPMVKYFDFKIPEIARAASVSTSTVTRWKPESSIGLPGSNQFFKMDELVRKGVSVFGGEEPFKTWLNSPNLAMGNAIPAKLIISVIGIDLVDEALDALTYGSVM